MKRKKNKQQEELKLFAKELKNLNKGDVPHYRVILDTPYEPIPEEVSLKDTLEIAN